MSNRLKNETSPYLAQHAENPVDWYPWCEAAFEKAKNENKPIFLSIGYSTCHWCHVMAHESFEDEGVAEILNRNFISIKVDREERPDIDSVYMSVCQAFTGSGGWPMSIFMTWDKKPFFAGTYFPPHSRGNMPGFSQLLNTISDMWIENRERLLESADEIISHIRSYENTRKRSKSGDLYRCAVRTFTDNFDSVNGGFGRAPKFPTPHNLLFLMLYSSKTGSAEMFNMAEKTLIQMRKGGIFDHIGYGFSRYSTDEKFLVPHFEKMLYDNALLMIAYSTAYYMTKNDEYLQTAKNTAEYILNEMTGRDGGFYSAQDADSEGVEGKFYTFTLAEILDVLGHERGSAFASAFDITEQGNFEGANIPNTLKGDLNVDYSSEVKKLYTYRKRRMKLHLDDKVLISWNSLMIAAFSMLYRASGEGKYLSAAIDAQRFIESNLCEGKNLYTSYRDGKRSEKGFLDDYAFYIAALIELYGSTMDNSYLEKAQIYTKEVILRFKDKQNGGFYLCEDSELFTNPKDSYDGAVPSGNSAMAYNFVRLMQITGKEKYRAQANEQIEYMSTQTEEYPAGYCMFLIAKLMCENPVQHITIALKEESDLKNIKEKVPFLADITVTCDYDKYPLLNGNTAYYICRDGACLPPREEF